MPITVTRLSLPVPDEGDAVEYRVTGKRLIIEEAPEEDPASVSTIHFGSPEGDGIPCIRRAQFADTGGWNLFFLRGNGGAEGTVDIIVLGSLSSLLELPE